MIKVTIVQAPIICRFSNSIIYLSSIKFSYQVKSRAEVVGYTGTGVA